jgi:hypothetical protein
MLMVCLLMGKPFCVRIMQSAIYINEAKMNVRIPQAIRESIYFLRLW